MAKRRTSYEAYKDWYDYKVYGKTTKSWQKKAKPKDISKYYEGMLTEDEYNKMAAKAHRKGIKNIARTIAYSQELVNKKLRKQYKERYNKDLGDMRAKEDREQVFLDFYAEMSADGYSHEQIEEMFNEYFY